MAGTVISGHSAMDLASDSFNIKTRRSRMDSTKPWEKDRFCSGWSGTPDPLWSFDFGIELPRCSRSARERSGQHWASPTAVVIL